MKIDEVIELMETLLEKSSTVPFSNKKMIDGEQLGEYIDNLKMAMPGEIKRAKDMARDKDNIIAEANKKAEEIIRQAEERAKVLVSEQEVIKQATEIAREQVKRANDQADEIVAQAVSKDKDIRNALAANLDKVLSDAEVVLNKSLTDVMSTKSAILKIGAPE